MTEWTTPQKPAEMAENQLIASILDGSFPINTTLPPERELARMLGVTRPTLREVLQRLSRDGWLEIHHGKSTRVRDYWHEGNLHILSTIARHQQHLPSDFISQLLQIRVLLAPEYTRKAILNAPAEVIHLLESMQTVSDTAGDFTRVDIELHYRLSVLSGNPVFTLILNGFTTLNRDSGLVYFASSQTRDHSRSFYKKLLSAALSNDVFMAEELTRSIMRESLHFWNELFNKE
ncbi:MAG: fatty acid metabolism transcriptional regulator FadR [Anaerolineaceae bacterium]|nr:fatty acid metabolism transcriptional regulator FadR [Anaerolineaceae bacterium]